MKDLMGLIYTGDNDEKLSELTSLRPVAAVPVCARYRVMDFILSSMVSSGARNVGIIMQKNYRSLMDHLGSGKEWDLHGKRQGLSILPPFMTRSNVGVYAGFLDAIRSNLPFLRDSNERYVVVSDSRNVYTARFDDMLCEHLRTGADITLMYTDDREMMRTGGEGHYMAMDEAGRVTDMESQPMIPHYDHMFMDAFLMRRELLIDLVDRAVARGQYHFTRDLLFQAIRNRELKIYGWHNANRSWHLDSVQAYYDCSMELLDPAVRASLFPAGRPVLTKLRDEMPTQHAPGAQVRHSLLADGCVIEGTVENSILSRGVHVQKGAVVRNAVVMQDGLIMAGATVEGCILDKQVIVRQGVTLCAPRTYPVVIAKNTIV